MAKKRIVDEEMRFNLVVNSNQAQKDLYDTEKAIRNLKDEGKALRAERAKLVSQGKKDSEEYKRLTQAIKDNSAEVKLNQTRLNELQKQIGINGLSMAQLQSRARTLQLQLRHMIPGSAEYKRYEAELKTINARLKELRGSAISTESSLSKLAGGFNKYAAMGTAFLASLTGVIITMQKMIDYNGKMSDSLADVRKTTGLTVDEVDELNKSFGAFNTRTSRVELLKLAEDAGRLGITGVENLRAYTEQANKLRVALKDDLSETQIMEIGKMVNIYKVGEATAKDFAGSMDALGSAINEVSYSGANQAGYLVEYLKRQAGVASQTRISAADNVGYAATFDEIGQSVEISATMMNKVFIDMFENTSEYAKIAGMDMREFSELLATDANEAMLRFLEGLNGNNEGLGVMVQKMDKLQAGGTRGVQALAALASSTATIRSRQETANKALQEATSLTDEYNIKNNNLAAVLEKVNRRMHAFMAGERVTKLLTSLVTGFGTLIGAVKDMDKELDKSIKLTHESAKANIALAVESERLLKRYEELTKDGIKPSREEKEELDRITLKLKDSLGESVVEINKETGALSINTEAVRQQIAVKRLAADQEAATNASRLVGVQEQKIVVAEQLKALANEYVTRKRIFEQDNKDRLQALENQNVLSAKEKQRVLESMDGYEALSKARRAYYEIDYKMLTLVEREKELIKGLEELGYSSQEAIKAIVGDMPNLDEIVIPDVVTKSDGNREKLLEQLKKDILKATQSAEDARIALLNDSYLEELLNMQMAHQRKMEALEEQLMDEAEIMRQPLEFRKLYRERNAAVNKQIEEDTKLHGLRAADLVQKGIQQQLDEQQEQYEREKTLREQKYAAELLAYSGHEKEQEELRKKHQAEELAEQQKYLEEQLRQFKLILEQGDFGGFDLDLLNEEQKIEIESMLEDLKLKLLEVKQAKDALGGAETEGLDLGAAGDIDIFGFTAQDWVDTFENIETLEQGVEAAAMAVQGLMNAWSEYNRFVTENENKRFKEFEKNNNEKKKRLKDRLDAGVLNQRQYDKALTELEEKADKEKAELEYKQAKRAWEMQLIQSIANTALGITQALSSSPPPASFILAGIVGAMGMIQQGLLRKNKPVKGYEEGLIPDEWLFPVEREQDGKIFNARYGGQRISGLVNEPTLVGERPELVISNPDLKKFDPAITRSVMNEIRRVKGYEVGYIGPTTAAAVEQNPQPQADYGLSPELAMEMIGLLRELRDQGIMAYLVRDMENTKMLQDDLDRLKKYKDKARL